MSVQGDTMPVIRRAEVNDRFATAFQEAGIASATALSLAEVVASVEALGIDPRHVVVQGTVFTAKAAADAR